ncbi:hypothetical protein JCM9279_006240 [Rhodotorula babjevae]
MSERARTHSLYAAGSNSHGQLGPLHRDDLLRWTRISFPRRLGQANVKSLACGANHSLVVANDPQGRAHLLAAGSDARGQLSARSDPRLRLAFEPVDLERLCDSLHLPLPVDGYEVERVAAAWETSFVVLRPRDPASTASDVLLSFGANDWGERGCASATRDEPSVVVLEEASPAAGYAASTLRIVDLVAGPRHALALIEANPPSTSSSAEALSRRRLVGWGASRHGQLGLVPSSSTPPRITPIPHEVLLPAPYDASSVVGLAVGRDHSAVLLRRAEGEGEVDKVLLLGSNKHGQLGAPLAGPHAVRGAPTRHHIIYDTDLVPASGPRLSRLIDAVHCTWSSTFLALSSSSTCPPVLAFGLNGHGQLGVPSPSPPLVHPHQHGVASAFPASRTVRALAAGSEHVVALLDCGGDSSAEREVWGWGWNEHGNLGLAAGAGEERREGEGEQGVVVPADVRTPRRVWPPDNDDAGASEERGQLGGRPVRVWAGMASSWILVEEDRAAE